MAGIEVNDEIHDPVNEVTDVITIQKDNNRSDDEVDIGKNDFMSLTENKTDLISKNPDSPEKQKKSRNDYVFIFMIFIVMPTMTIVVIAFSIKLNHDARQRIERLESALYATQGMLYNENNAQPLYEEDYEEEEDEGEDYSEDDSTDEDAADNETSHKSEKSPNEKAADDDGDSSSKKKPSSKNSSKKSSSRKTSSRKPKKDSSSKQVYSKKSSIPKQKVLIFSDDNGFEEGSKPSASSGASSDSSEDITSSDTASSPAEIVITPQMNDSLAQEMNANFSTNVIIARKPNDYADNVIKQYASDEAAINNALQAFSRIFSGNKNLISNELAIKNIVIIGDDVVGKMLLESDESLLVSSNKKVIVDSLHDALMEIVSNALTQKVYKTKPNIFKPEFQPDKFQYGITFVKECIYPRPSKQLAYFCSANAQNSQTDDIISTLDMLILNQDAVLELEKSAKLMPKFKAAAEFAVLYFPSIATEDAVEFVLQ